MLRKLADDLGISNVALSFAERLARSGAAGAAGRLADAFVPSDDAAAVSASHARAKNLRGRLVEPIAQRRACRNEADIIELTPIDEIPAADFIRTTEGFGHVRSALLEAMVQTKRCVDPNTSAPLPFEDVKRLGRTPHGEAVLQQLRDHHVAHLSSAEKCYTAAKFAQAARDGEAAVDAWAYHERAYVVAMMAHLRTGSSQDALRLGRQAIRTLAGHACHARIAQGCAQFASSDATAGLVTLTTIKGAVAAGDHLAELCALMAHLDWAAGLVEVARQIHDLDALSIEGAMANINSYLLDKGDYHTVLTHLPKVAGGARFLDQARAYQGLGQHDLAMDALRAASGYWVSIAKRATTTSLSCAPRCPNTARWRPLAIGLAPPGNRACAHGPSPPAPTPRPSPTTRSSVMCPHRTFSAPSTTTAST